MSGRTRDKSKKRESILDAAVQAFVEEGYDNTSMDRIAELAAASKRTVYNHFPSKEELFAAVLARFQAESTGLKAIAYRADRSLEAQLRAFIDAKLAVVQDPTSFQLVRVALARYMRDTDLARAAMAQYMSGDDALVAWLEAAAADGRLEVRDASMAATLFWSLVGGALSWPQLLAGTMESAEVEVLSAEIVETFLCRYRR